MPNAGWRMWVILVALLAAHFATRWRVAAFMRAEPALFAPAATFYPDVYRASLSLAEGRGFHSLSIGGPPRTEEAILSGSTEELRPEAVPLAEFFRLGRMRLSRDELDAYWASQGSGCIPTGNYEPGRVLDIHLVALAWRMFGVSWVALHGLSCLASTLCCLGIVLTAWRLSGSFLAGLASGVLFLASPFESHFTARTIRDVSPLWFATYSFTFFVLAEQRSDRWWVNALSWLGLGAVAAVGVGWRADALLLAPVLLVALVVVVWRDAGWRSALLSGPLFVAGVAGVFLLIGAMSPKSTAGGGAGNNFHVAFYGYSARANLLGLENSLAVARDDLGTHFRASVRGPERIYGPGYGEACRAMYFEALPYHAHAYARWLPWFAWQALSAFPAEGMLQAEDVILLGRSRIRGTIRVYSWLLDPLTRLLPWLFLVGVAALYVGGMDAGRGGWLVAFAAYYLLVFLAVLPERKHLGQLLLPLYVFAGIGISAVVRPRWDPKGWRWGAGLAGAAVLLWLATCALTYPVSYAARQRLLAELRAAAEAGSPAPECVVSPHQFIARLPATGRHERDGFLLEIEAEGGLLECRTVRPRAGIDGRAFTTRHRLVMGRQVFAVGVPRSAGDPRRVACSVALPEGARIVSCLRVRLDADGVATVFTENDSHAGPPVVAGPAAADLVAGCVPTAIVYEAEGE